ncbi:MAG: hypothetical protein PW786_01785 [Arachidicoccus sp.]|nr:hypothetical protein [Arachidicoccus sp.]
MGFFSAGFDSRVLVFDPYLPTPTGALAAHHTNILDVVVNERKNQIITTCADKKIKVFDIRTFKCIQSLADSQEYTPYDELTAVTFDQDQQQLVTAGNKIRAWPVAIAPGNKARRGGPAHSNLVVAICFSQVFQQIISVSVDESVHLWDIYTGKSVFEFRTTHGSPLTAACLDHRGKRLITGAHNGTVLMWNFNNGGLLFSFSSLTSLPRRKLAHEFGPRKKEVTSLLYLPRTLQCVVGIGWERSVVRWPDPNAPKNTEWLVQPDHRAEVCSVAYFGSILVTGGSDGEIIVWHMDSARVNKRMDIPKTPRSGKRPGVAKMLFVDFPSGLLLLLAGTDDGSLHFIKVGTSETVFSLFEVYDDPIVGMAANRLDDPDTDVELKFHGARTRLLVADCQAEAKLWDISGITSEQITCVPLLKVWEPHPGGTTTDVIAVDDIQSFMCSSDTGEISVWSTEGEPRAKFAQRKAWPIADPRTSSAGTAEDVATERREAGLSNDQDQATDAEADSDASDESDNDMGTRSSLSTRQASMMSRGSANSSRRGARSRAGITATPPRKELSFAESHPMYVPRDECDKYLKDYAHQSQMESAAAAKEKLAAERERRDERLAAAGGGGGKHAKSGLADMLGKLEADLRHQHERAAHAHHQSGGGGFGGGGNGASSPSHGTTTISGGNGGFTLDATSAIQGAHVYERFHAHHATGASAASSSNATSGLHLHATDSSAATSDANTERTPRPPRVRHVHTTGSAFEERDSDPVSGGAASGSLSARSFSGGRTAAASSSATAGTFLSHRDRARVPLAHGARTISNSDVFVQSGSNRTRQQQQRRLA